MYIESPKSSAASSGIDQQSMLRNRGTKHVSQKEWEERPRKGLFFRCAQPYSPQHRCPEGKLRVLLLADDEDVTGEGKIFLVEVETAVKENEVRRIRGSHLETNSVGKWQDRGGFLGG